MLVIRDIFLVSTWKWNSPSFHVCFPPCVHPLCSNPLKDPQVLTKWTSQRMLSSQDASRIRQPGRWTAPAAICVGPVFYFYVDVDLYSIDFYERYDRYCRISKGQIEKRDSHCRYQKLMPRMDLFSIVRLFFVKTERWGNIESYLNNYFYGSEAFDDTIVIRHYRWHTIRMCFGYSNFRISLFDITFDEDLEIIL